MAQVTPGPATQKPPRPREIRRVLVALDPMAQCQAALDTAARLAARAHAELVGLFVEESELLAAAALPVTRALRPHDFADERLDEAVMARGLRAWAAHAEAQLNASAARFRVKASFRVARGRIADVLTAEARLGDLVALGTAARPSRRPRLGGTARALSRGLVCPVLVMRGPGGADAPIVVVYDGNARALALGAELAGLLETRLEVLVIEAALKESARAWLEAEQVPGEVRRIEDGKPAEVLADLLARPASLVVLDRSGRPGSEIEAERLLLGSGQAVVVLG